MIEEVYAGVDGSPLNEQTSPVELSYDDLTTLQKQRVDYLQGIIGNQAIGLVRCLDSRGKNSWEAVFQKIMRINEATRSDRTYHDALYENFSVGREYTFAQIMGVIAEVRRDLRLAPYLMNTKSSCESDLFELFIVKEIWQSEESVSAAPKRKLIGYKPTFRIKPEEIN